MSSRRYADDPDYGRSEPRHSTRRELPRERDRDRVESTRERRIDDRSDRDTRMTDAMDTRMDRLDTRIDSRLDSRMDSRMDTIRTDSRDQRANTASRIDRPDRVVDSHSADPEAEIILQDPTTGQYYRQVRGVPSRSPYAPEERDYDVPSRSRAAMDTSMRVRDPLSLRPENKEYWCPGEGIEREVIQHEICKYLGNDATCRPGRDPQGRSGYWVRAYRPFTTAMEQSLRDDTVKWQRERERRRRQGESRGSYADMATQQETRRGYGPMDLDDDDYQRPPPRHRDLDSRPVASGRVSIPVTSSYLPEPGYPAHSQYSISSSQPSYPPGQTAYYGTEREPRLFNSGNTTPPSISRSGQPAGYGQPGYPPRTAPPVTASISASYGDPRRDIMGGIPPGYSDSRRR